jgi:hypothetical protein
MNRLLPFKPLAFLSLPVGQPINTVLLPSVAGGLIEIDGNLVPAASFQAAMGQINSFNIADTAYNFSSSAAAALTLSSLGNVYQKLTNGGAVTVTLDGAYNIVTNLQNPFLGQTGFFTIFSSGAGTVATPTLTDTTVTLSGTTSIAAGNARVYQWQITQLATTTGSAVTSGTTFTSLAQVGTTNQYTVTLATNAITPVVGNVIFINVTAGTLPSGWYPISKVTSATSFQIVAPIAGTAWTATAATIPGTAVVPSSQYQTGYTSGVTGVTGIFSPLLTITAVESHAATV